MKILTKKQQKKIVSTLADMFAALLDMTEEFKEGADLSYGEVITEGVVDIANDIGGAWAMGRVKMEVGIHEAAKAISELMEGIKSKEEKLNEENPDAV